MRMPRPSGTLQRLRLAAPAAAFAFALALVAGCATTPPSSADAANAEKAAAAARLAALPPRTPAPPGADPAQLRGMPAHMVRTLLGEPRLIRHEPPAEVWLYAAGNCIFHVFMYDEAGTGSYHVVHYDVAASSRSIQPVNECFASVLSRAEHRARES